MLQLPLSFNVCFKKNGMAGLEIDFDGLNHGADYFIVFFNGSFSVLIGFLGKVQALIGS